MKTNQFRRFNFWASLFLASLAVYSTRILACTIFVLTDTNQALFCNNEDWSNPKTKIWFIPAGKGYFGAAYVGFDDGWPQGGLNTEGLAFDWVAGYNEKYMPDGHLPAPRGCEGQRMLETCSTVGDAIAFFQNHSIGELANAKALVADKTGASVIIGAHEGHLVIDKDNRCRGFGFGEAILNLDLAAGPEPTITNGFKILRDCRQKGRNATKYSNIYDMKSGEIFLFPFSDRDNEVILNLAAELKKGAHDYDMPLIFDQLNQTRPPLPISMRRFPVDEYKAIPDPEPGVSTHLHAMITGMAEGTFHSEDFDSGMWKIAMARQKQIQASYKALGNLVSMDLVDRTDAEENRGYRYRVEFSKAIVLQAFWLDAQKKVTRMAWLAVEHK